MLHTPHFIRSPVYETRRALPVHFVGNPRRTKPCTSCNPFHQSFAVIKRFPSGFTWPTFNIEPSAHLTTSEFVDLLNIAAPGWEGRFADVAVVVVKSWSWRDCEVGRWVKRGFFSVKKKKKEKSISQLHITEIAKQKYLVRESPMSSADGVCWHGEKFDEGIVRGNHGRKWKPFSRSLRHRSNLHRISRQRHP